MLSLNLMYFTVFFVLVNVYCEYSYDEDAADGKNISSRYDVIFSCMTSFKLGFMTSFQGQSTGLMTTLTVTTITSPRSILTRIRLRRIHTCTISNSTISTPAQSRSHCTTLDTLVSKKQTTVISRASTPCKS